MENKCECEKEEEFSKLKIIRISLTSILIFLATIDVISFVSPLYIYILAYVVISYDVFIETVKNIRHGEIFDEAFLMFIATICAFFVKEYAEAVLVMLLYQVGEFLEDMAVDSGKHSITGLLDMKANIAHLVNKDETKDIKVEEIKVNDILLVKVGERIPVDGIVLEGTTSLDTSSLTGESLPVDKKINDEVLSGSINLSAVIKIKAIKVVTESTATKILECIQESEEAKSNSEKFITKFARIYTPVVVIIAVCIATIPLLFKESFSVWGYRACIFLVISCPCALVISVPLSFFVGIAKASKLGVLFKGSNHLENLSKIDTILFDKTGTLTEGKLKVVKVNGSKDIVEKACIAESLSTHPIAKAICDYYGKAIKFKVKDYKEIAGQGTSVIYEGKEIKVGKASYIRGSKEVNENGTVIHVSYDNEYLGYIVISDSIKEDTLNAIKEFDIQVGILSGDNKFAVNDIAKTLEINNIHANLLPIDKVKVVEEYLNNNKTVAFVGDGINDAPVLTKSTVGISMGGIGSEAAIEASDIVIMNDKISSIVKARKVAKITMKKVYVNIAVILIVKLAAMILGVLDILPMWGATIADVGVCLLTILNSVLIYFKKIK